MYVYRVVTLCVTCVAMLCPVCSVLCVVYVYSCVTLYVARVRMYTGFLLLPKDIWILHMKCTLCASSIQCHSRCIIGAIYRVFSVLLHVVWLNECFTQYVHAVCILSRYVTLLTTLLCIPCMSCYRVLARELWMLHVVYIHYRVTTLCRMYVYSVSRVCSVLYVCMLHVCMCHRVVILCMYVCNVRVLYPCKHRYDKCHFVV